MCGEPCRRLTCFLGLRPRVHCRVPTPIASGHRIARSPSSLKESAWSVSHSIANLIRSVLDLAEFTWFLLAFPMVLINFGAIIAYFGIILCYTILRRLVLCCGEGWGLKKALLFIITMALQVGTHPHQSYRMVNRQCAQSHAVSTESTGSTAGPACLSMVLLSPEPFWGCFGCQQVIILTPGIVFLITLIHNSGK